MSFFKKIFSSKKVDFDRPEFRFGRYTDAYKKDDQYDYWDQALELFEKEDYQESYRLFFEYLKDENEDNVKYWKEGSALHFEVLQGSKKIEGFIEKNKVRAEAKIAQADSLNIGFLRRLVEQNFGLKYGRYALDEEEDIAMVFDSYMLDGSPYKLYYALKEVAINADKQDDVLIDEFDMLNPVNTGHTNKIPREEKEVKYWFLHREIAAVFDEIENGKLDANQYPGGIAYLLLHLVHKLDYLIKPEGFTMEKLEKIHRNYFSEEQKSIPEKSLAIQKSLRKIIERSKEDFFKELYTVSSTFGITTPVNHDRVISFIDGELGKMDWYRNNKHDKIALAIPGYIVGFCLFNYAVPEPDKDYLHLFYQITEVEYFKKLGFDFNYYDPQTGVLNKKEIVTVIEYIAKKYKAEYPKLKVDTTKLVYTNLVDFAKSYMLFIRNLDLTKPGKEEEK